MEVDEHIREVVKNGLPETAQGFAANGAGLSKFKREQDVDDEELTYMLSFFGFRENEGYAVETRDDYFSSPVSSTTIPRDILVFRLLVRFPDDEDYNADGYSEIRNLVRYIREQKPFLADDGKRYTLSVTNGSATPEERFAEEVFELYIEAG